MNIIEVKNLSKDYKYKVKNEEKGFLYNLFNEQEKIYLTTMYQFVRITSN